MIRKLQESDLEPCLALTEFAFKLQFTPEQRAARLLQMKSEEHWGYFEEDQLAAKLTLLPFDITIDHQTFAMSGVASVATWPEFRRRGMVGKLMAYSLQVMRERGQSVSVLNPFSFRFYDKYGWGHFCEIKRYRFSAGMAPRSEDVPGTVIRRNASALTDLRLIYDQFSTTFNGMLQRTDDWWHRSVLRKKLGNLAVYYSESGIPQGYVLYGIRDRLFDLYELAALTEESRRGLWRFIANHAPMVDNFTLPAPSDDRLPFLLEEPMITTELNACYMIRIVDLIPFLEKYPFKSTGLSYRFQLCIKDEHAPWNDGTFELKVNEEGQASVSRSKDSLREEDALTCSIQTLSSMMIGYITPTELNKLGRLQGKFETANQFNQLVTKKVPYFMDMF